jgi:hypothetical protein
MSIKRSSFLRLINSGFGINIGRYGEILKRVGIFKLWAAVYKLFWQLFRKAAKKPISH